VKSLQPEQRQWMKKCVYENLAPAHNGKISMALLNRLFSEYGNSRELQEIMNEFVTDNQVKVVQKNGETIFVFTAIAREIGAIILQDLKKFEKETQGIKSKIEANNRQLQFLDDACAKWRSGWDELLKDSDAAAVVINYVITFWSEQQHKILNEINGETGRLNDLENRISTLRGKIDESYEDP
jgi:hypothetical protein